VIDVSGTPVGDISGAAAPAANEDTTTRASDLATLDDATLLKELGLGSAANSDSAAAPDAQATDDADTEGDQGASDSAAAEGDSEVEGADDAAGESGDGSETGTAEGEGGEGAEAESGTAPAVGFSIFQGADEVEIPNNLKIKFKADGEDREVDLPGVVRLAQMGYYNEQRATEIKEFREQLPQIRESFESLQSENEMLTTAMQRILSGDEEYLAQEQEEFLRASSPEARAERAERALEQERLRQRGAGAEQQAAQFVRSLVPEFETLQTVAPKVSFEEVVGKFNMLTAPLMVRGQIPPAKFREVERIIRSELRPWAEAQHARRVNAEKATTAVATRATATAALAKKQAARAVLPQGTHPTGAPPKAAKKYESAGDIMDDLDDIVPRASNP
jgi:hypothetical protein